MLSKPCVKVKTRRPKHSVAEIFHRWIDDYRQRYRLSYEQTKVVNAITRCHTAAMGGYVWECDTCDKQTISYCPCKNRHCPGCGHFEKAQWLEKQKAVLLPVAYYQTVFTIDHVFNPLVWCNKKQMFNLLFRVSARLLKEYGQKYLGGEIGMTAILHTWGQRLQAHPHVHYMVSGGALVQTETGVGWQAAKRKFLFPVTKLSQDFRRAFCQGLKRLWEAGELEWDEEKGKPIAKMIAAAMSQRWEVYIKPPPAAAEAAKPENLLEYLGRYMQGSAISNYRIEALHDDGVQFRYRDNRDGGDEKMMELEGVEFIRRFLLHVLPQRFMRIRHYGLHHGQAKEKRRQARVLLGLPGKLPLVAKLKLVEWLASFLEEDPNTCPHCGQGRLRRKREFSREQGWRSLLEWTPDIPIGGALAY